MTKFVFLLFTYSLYLVLFLTNIEAATVSSNSNELIVIFRNDDPSAISNFDQERKIFQLFESYNIPQTIGVIPYAAKNYWDSSSSEYVSLLDNKEMLGLLKEYKQKKLIEIALHGYLHQTNKFYAYSSRKSTYYNSLSEFRRISYSRQLEKIIKGKDILASYFHDAIDVFIPPFNSYDKTTLKALEETNFSIISASLERNEIQSSENIINISATTDIYRLPESIEFAQDFVKENDASVAIVCLYHSSDINTPEKFKTLKTALELIISNNIKTYTLSEFYVNYYFPLQQINKVIPGFFWVHKAESFYNLISWLNIKSLFVHHDYIILNSHLFRKQLLKSKIICFFTYSGTILVAIFFALITAILRKKMPYKSKIVKFLCLTPMVILFFLVFIVINKSYFSLSPGIGWKAELLIVYFLSLSLGNILFGGIRKNTEA